MSNDAAYNNRDHIADADSYPPRWERASAACRDRWGDRARLGLRYGDTPREAFDLFVPEGPARGTVVFVHGGYWRAFDRSVWSEFAQGALAAGFAVAMPSYTLAPQARIAEITRQIAAAVTAVAGMTQGPLHLTGHSAGGHLVARMLCADVALPDAVAERMATCVPVSPVADLRPLLDTAMNDDLRLDASEAAAESPALLPLARNVPVTVWVGADERPAFLDQATWLGQAWNVPVRIEPGRHHFDIIDGLRSPDSPLMRAVLGV